MKRILAVLLFLCVLPVCAFALDDLDDFDMYADLFGAPMVKSLHKDTVGNKVVYDVNGGYVGFEENSGKLTSVSVMMDGDCFLIYSLAAFCVMENGSENFSDNCGILLSEYMMCRMNQEERMRTTKGGLFFLIQPYKGKYMIVIER